MGPCAKKHAHVHSHVCVCMCSRPAHMWLRGSNGGHSLLFLLGVTPVVTSPLLPFLIHNRTPPFAKRAIFSPRHVSIIATRIATLSTPLLHSQVAAASHLPLLSARRPFLPLPSARRLVSHGPLPSPRRFFPCFPMRSRRFHSSSESRDGDGDNSSRPSTVAASNSSGFPIQITGPLRGGRGVGVEVGVGVG